MPKPRMPHVSVPTPDPRAVLRTARQALPLLVIAGEVALVIAPFVAPTLAPAAAARLAVSARYLALALALAKRVA